jgi:hypothetical protein
MCRVIILLVLVLFSGCASPVKETGTVKESGTIPMTEARAVEIAVAAARERGWKGPFDTFVSRSDERGVSQWGSVRMLDKDKESRLLIVYISKNGEVLDFSVRPQ